MSWYGKLPHFCDLCHQDFTDYHFVDGKTKYGPWATMCCACHYWNGIGFGEGLGQKYDIKTGARLVGEFDNEAVETARKVFKT